MIPEWLHGWMAVRSIPTANRLTTRPLCHFTESDTLQKDSVSGAGWTSVVSGATLRVGRMGSSLATTDRRADAE